MEGKLRDISSIARRKSKNEQNPKDRSAHKRKLSYWIELAKILERGGINALFLADTYGGYDTYEGSLDNCIRRAAQWPVTDPTIVSCPCCCTVKREKYATKCCSGGEPHHCALSAPSFSSLQQLR
jgi:hypothetical protein